MKIAITGANGIVGRFIVDAALSAGHEVTSFGRRPLEPPFGLVGWAPWDLGGPADLAGFDTLIHAAFSHQPGRYRGGEGDDPTGFRRSNLAGSINLFEQARAAGVGRVIFMSSRAVFDGYPAGTPLTEDLPPLATSLYGQVKILAEEALAAMRGPTFQTVSLRSTGVYGVPPGSTEHKWQGLFADFAAGRAIEPGIGTEVHGQDLGRAAVILLTAMAACAYPNAAHPGLDDTKAVPPATRFPPAPNGRARSAGAPSSPLASDSTRNARTANPDRFSHLPSAVHLSDIILDKRTLLEHVARAAGMTGLLNLPPSSEPSSVSVLSCDKMASIGWRPGGWSLFDDTVIRMIQS